MNELLAIDPTARTVGIAGRHAVLTRRELAVLLMLADAAGGIVPAEIILHQVWTPHSPMPNLRVAIGNLRGKIEIDRQLPAIILTVPGEGYRLAPQLTLHIVPDDQQDR